jgi:L-malate glycosyltransferase
MLEGEDMIQTLRSNEFNKRLARLPYAEKQLLTRRREEKGQLHIVYAMTHVGICGGVKVIFEHAKTLTKAGAKVTLVSHFQKPSWFPIEADYIQVPFGLDLAKGIPNCDVIVATYWDHIQACIETGIAPVVYFEQGDFHLFDYETMNSPLKNFIHKQFDIVPFVYTVSNQASELIRDVYGREAEVFPNAVNDRIFSVHGEKVIGERPYILMVGGESSTFKRIPDIFEAYENVSKEMDIDLYWITPEQPSDKMKDSVAKVFVNPPQQMIGNLYRGADLYVCGSSYENFPLPPLEAMACGCPVVTTNNRGSLEYAIHQKNAYICNMKDPEDMAAKILEVLTNEETKEKLITNGLSTAKLYHWDTIIQDVYAYYKRVASHDIDGVQDEWEMAVQPEDFTKPGDYEKFIKFLRVTHADLVKVPVLHEVEKVPRIARWEVMARRKNGEQGLTEYCFCPVNTLNKLQLLNYQGYSSFLVKDYERALEEFQSQYEQGHAEEKAVAARWMILALMRLQRKQEAKKRLKSLRKLYPHNADFYLLAMLVTDEENAKDPNLQYLKVLGDAASYPEFFFDIQNY